MKKKNHLWPKQRIWHHLGPFSSSLPTPSRILFLRIYIYYKILVTVIHRLMKHRKLNGQIFIWKPMYTNFMSTFGWV